MNPHIKISALCRFIGRELFLGLIMIEHPHSLDLPLCFSLPAVSYSICAKRTSEFYFTILSVRCHLGRKGLKYSQKTKKRVKKRRCMNDGF